jgi:predicted RNA binding protein YcfA (HicA-like mRNA interferase family)
MARRKHVSTSEVVTKIVRRLVDVGWSLDRGTRHHRMRSPDGKINLTVAGSPSDHRAALNWISQIRRQGVPEQILEGL